MAECPGGLLLYAVAAGEEVDFKLGSKIYAL